MIPGLIPHLDAPMAHIARAQRLAGVGDVRREIAFDTAAVPQIAFPRSQVFCRAGDAHAPGNLPGTPAIGLDHPTQARGTFVNAERRDKILTAQMRNA